MMRRLVAIHASPRMRGVAPAFVCSVGSRVVVIDASRFGMRCSFMRFPVMRPSDYPHGQGVAVAPSLMTCGHRQEKQRHLPLALPISFQDEWGRLLARLTSPVFAQVANDGQRCVVGQVKREGAGLVLLGCRFRVHMLGCGRAASWTEPDHGRAAARVMVAALGFEPRETSVSAQAPTPIPLAWSPFGLSGTRQKWLR